MYVFYDDKCIGEDFCVLFHFHKNCHHMILSIIIITIIMATIIITLITDSERVGEKDLWGPRRYSL